MVGFVITDLSCSEDGESISGEEAPLVIEEAEQEEIISNHVTENNVNHSLNSVPDQSKHTKKEKEIHKNKSLSNHKKEALIWTHNTRLRHTLFKEIKKPGRSKLNCK